MRYTKYTALMATLSILSISTLAFAATGDTGTWSEAVTWLTAPVGVIWAPRLVKKTADSITLEWDAFPSAVAYIVKYSKTSVATSKDPNATYDNETDQITTTGAVLTKLISTNEKFAPGTSYFFSLVTLDKDLKESDTFSDELMVTTDSATGTTMGTPSTSLAIKDLFVMNDKTLTLSFNSNLSTDPVQVKITKTSDNSTIAISSVVPDQTSPNMVVISTLSALSPASSYTLTILSAKDALGNNIQEGISGLKEFTTTETLKSSTPVAVTPVIASDTTSDTTSGATLAAASPEAATKVATGAKENVIVFAALLLSLGIVYIYRRKLI